MNSCAAGSKGLQSSVKGCWQCFSGALGEAWTWRMWERPFCCLGYSPALPIAELWCSSMLYPAFISCHSAQWSHSSVSVFLNVRVNTLLLKGVPVVWMSHLHMWMLAAHSSWILVSCVTLSFLSTLPIAGQTEFKSTKLLQFSELAQYFYFV